MQYVSNLEHLGLRMFTRLESSRQGRGWAILGCVMCCVVGNVVWARVFDKNNTLLGNLLQGYQTRVSKRSFTVSPVQNEQPPYNVALVHQATNFDRRDPPKHLL